MMRYMMAVVCLGGLCAQTPTFQTGVSQVRVDVEVYDRGGPVSNLALQHFKVKDNGHEQKVVHVTQNEEPLDVILVFDISGSMKKTVENVAATARKSLGQLRQGDRVSVMTFASRPRLLCGFTEDLQAVQTTIERDILDEPFEGATRIWDASYESGRVHFRQGRSGRRRAVVMITDNLGQKGKRDDDEALEALWEADAVLCAVVIGNPEFERRERHAIHVDKIVRETGGDLIYSEDPGEAFQKMIQRIRSRYSVYYEQPKGKGGEFRSVKVELQGEAKKLHPDARVNARKGYRLPD
ncbi:MAG: VWA domain-containing protein [Acidobacteria bacterium]|nr:VWA domain-containing protein [Acidobacteriota bacterium]